MRISLVPRTPSCRPTARRPSDPGRPGMGSVRSEDFPLHERSGRKLPRERPSRHTRSRRRWVVSRNQISWFAAIAGAMTWLRVSSSGGIADAASVSANAMGQRRERGRRRSASRLATTFFQHFSEAAHTGARRFRRTVYPQAGWAAPWSGVRDAWQPDRTRVAGPSSTAPGSLSTRVALDGVPSCDGFRPGRSGSTASGTERRARIAGLPIARRFSTPGLWRRSRGAPNRPSVAGRNRVGDIAHRCVSPSRLPPAMHT